MNKRNRIIYNKKAISRSRLIFILLGISFLFIKSCIAPYTANYEGNSDTLVVDGSLIKGNDEQIIKISRASSILLPKDQYAKIQPLSGCQVKIVDDIDNEFIFTERNEGEYVAIIDDALLNYEAQYKLMLKTPNGDDYESDFQQLLKSYPVDSVYSIREYHYNTEQNTNDIGGFQLYVDLNTPDDASKYYRFQIEETWEVRSSYVISGIWDGNTVTLNDWWEDSIYYCWKSKYAEGIYTTSCLNLSQNKIVKIPLLFKLEDSKELGVKYCATVKQFPLDKNAYNYWHQKEIELTESGQIYTSQPSQVESNVHNINNPKEKVLGYFWVSSVSFKRTFLENGIGGEFPFECEYISIMPDSPDKHNIEAEILQAISVTRNIPNPPLYIYRICSGGCIYYVALSDFCIDCRKMEGTIVKPDFWGPHQSD